MVNIMLTLLDERKSVRFFLWACLLMAFILGVMWLLPDVIHAIKQV